jgi:hypothetical protein
VDFCERAALRISQFRLARAQDIVPLAGQFVAFSLVFDSTQDVTRPAVSRSSDPGTAGVDAESDLSYCVRSKLCSSCPEAIWADKPEVSARWYRSGMLSTSLKPSSGGVSGPPPIWMVGGWILTW